MSLISALIFWVTFSYLPEKKRKAKLRPVLELDMLQIYNNMFALFDLIMKPNKNSLSYYQNAIRGGFLTYEDIKLGLQNKCLNESYLFDSNISHHLFVIGEKIFDRSKNIDQLIDKVFNFSQYASAEEIILLEQIRQQIREYDYDEKDVKKSAISMIGNQKFFPMVPVLYYREKNFFELYQLYLKLQDIVVNKNQYFERNLFISKIQYLYYSKLYIACKSYINKNRKKFPKDDNLYKSYYALCEYYLGNKKHFYILLEELYKNRPYSGSLVSSRGTLKDFLDDEKAMEILANYHSVDELNKLITTIKKEDKLLNHFVETNKELSKYFSKQDTRLTAL